MADKIVVRKCPFTHLEGVKENVQVIARGDMFTVFCGGCGASGPASETPEGAINDWNARQVVILSESAYEALTEDGEDGEETTD